jgi:hypothetical protein
MTLEIDPIPPVHQASHVPDVMRSGNAIPVQEGDDLA